MALSDIGDALFLETLVNARFYLELKVEDPEGSMGINVLKGTEFTDAVFLECKGFKRSLDVVEITEAFYHKSQKKPELIGTKLPGKAKGENFLTLSRGLSASPTLWTWFNSVRDGNWHASRRNGSITIYDQVGIPCVRLMFYRAWPASINVGDFKADSANFAIETLELACEKVEHEDMSKAAAVSRGLQAAAVAARTIASPAVQSPDSGQMDPYKEPQKKENVQKVQLVNS